jgi:hypothetical protein
LLSSLVFLLFMVSVGAEAQIFPKPDLCEDCSGGCPQGQNVLPDCEYAPTVANPAYPAQDGPHVKVDQMHHNNHIVGCTYYGFGKLLEADGYRVGTSIVTFELGVPATTDILVIAGARPCAKGDTTCTSTESLTLAEANQLESWIRGGGRLLLILDHDPYHQLGHLLTKLGLEIVDASHLKRGFDATTGLTNKLIFSRDVASVCTFSGSTFRQILPPPAGATYIPTLTVDPTFRPTCTEVLPAPGALWFGGVAGADFLSIPGEPINPEMQGVAIRLDQGRVYVSGEAAMFTARCKAGTGDCGCDKVGMQISEAGDNETFLLNILHWLDN